MITNRHDELLGEIAISSLIRRLCLAMDLKDMSTMLNCFDMSSKAEETFSANEFVKNAMTVFEGLVYTQHTVPNIVVDFSSDCRSASAISSFVSFSRTCAVHPVLIPGARPGEDVTIGGFYRNSACLIDGDWKLISHDAELVWLRFNRVHPDGD